MTNTGLLVSSISSIEPLGFQAKSVEYTKKFRTVLEEDIHIQR
jgi:hypothetical protein